MYHLMEGFCYRTPKTTWLLENDESVRDIFRNSFNLLWCSGISTAHPGRWFSLSEMQGLVARRAPVVFFIGGFFVDITGFDFDV